MRFYRLSCLSASLFVALAACSSSSSSTNGAADGGTGALAINPTSAKVLTCSTLQFAETGGKGGGTWSVAPTTDGAIDTTGKYTPPTKAPLDTYTNPTAAEAVTISYAEGSQTATASVQLATAFMGAPVSVPNGANSNAKENVPFEHTFTANGTRVYAVVNGATPAGGEGSLTAEIYASNDSGATWTGPVSYHTGRMLCVTGAVDAANPDVLYMAYYAGHGDSSSNTGATLRLAVSVDGGKTFPTEYAIADSDNSIVDLICPDVASPSADHVIVAGGVGENETGTYAGAFLSANRGQGIGPVATPGSAAPSGTSISPATNSSTVHAECGPDDNGNGEGTRVVANGNGGACLIYRWVGDGCPSNGGDVVQCSTDNGATWTAPNALATPMSKARNIPTGAMSPGGNVAVTWIETIGDADEVHVAISKDNGKTFGAPIVYPNAVRTAFQNGYTSNPTVFWESDDILWLSQTFDGSDDAATVVDKTCDFGATWSGALKLGVNGYADGSFENLGLAKTTNGMVLFSSKADQLLAISLSGK